MAASSLSHAGHVTKEADLTDEQIELLLSRATQRLSVKTSSQEVAKINDGTRFNFPKLRANGLEMPLSMVKGQVAVVKSRDNQSIKQDTVGGIRKVEDPVLAKKLAKEQQQATAGSKWFDLPKTDLTPQLKRDLQLLKMRNVLDPHRHYKKDNGKMSVPEYSQVGTIVEGATEFYSGRIDNKKRKRTFIEEVLAGEQQTGRFKRKYGEVQIKKGSGKKAHYKSVQSKRRSGVKKGG